MSRRWVRVGRFRWVRVHIVEAYAGGWVLTVRRRLSPTEAARLRRVWGEP